MPIDRDASTRDRLLAATVACLRTDGLDGLTSREITNRAAANLQAITYHFGSKDALVAAALTDLVDQRLAPVRHALGAEGEPAARLVAALGTIKASFAANRDDLETYAAAMAACATNPSLARAVGELHAQLEGELSALISELQGDGLVQPWVSPPAIAALLLAIGDGLTVQASLGQPPVDAVLDQLALLLVAAGVQATDRTELARPAPPPHGVAHHG